MTHRLAAIFLTAAFVCVCPTAGAAPAAPRQAAQVPPEPPPIVQPGAPGESTRVITPEEAVAATAVAHTEADVRFMQGMIGHHAQALDMSALVPSRSASDAIGLLARRIEVSQEDEIQMMQEWLAARGEHAPGAHDHHAPGAPLMPGMLTKDEMDRLAGATGDEFDRLFLEFMIKHHEGALVMVDELFASPGAGQDIEIFQFASDVDADQRIEIRRMRNMLGLP